MPISLRLSPKVTTSDTAPISPTAGDQWWNTVDGGTYIYYNDGTSSQWVSASPPAINGTNSVVSVNSPLTYDSVNKIIGLNGTPVMNGSAAVVGIGGLANSTSQFAITDTVLAASGSLNGNALNIFQRWATTGNPTALLLNANNVSSGSTAKLIDLQVDGVTKFNVDKTGICNFERFILGPAGSTAGMTAYAGSDISITASAVNMPNIIKTGVGGYYAWTDGTNYGGTQDLKLYRDSANTLAQRNSTNSQTFRLYNTYTSVSDYERAVFDWTTVPNTLTLGTEAGGTGTKRLLNINTPTSITGTTASDLPTYASEFLGTPANFTLGAAWAGVLATGFTHTSGAGNTETITYSTLASTNTKYQIVTTVTGRTTGSYTVAFGGTSFPGIATAFTVGPTATATTGLVITPTFDFNGTIFISIKAITAISSALVSFKSSDGTVRSEIRSPTNPANPSSTFMGYQAGAYITIGANNSAFGYQALLNTTTGGNNSAFGSYALQVNTTGGGNIAIGALALAANTTGSGNIAIGVLALVANTTGNDNTAVGRNTLSANTTGYSNVAMGLNALNKNTTGNDNLAIGDNVMFENVTGTYNVALGTFAMKAKTSGNDNVAIGTSTLYSDYSNSGQVAVGALALTMCSSSVGSGVASNTAIGNNSLGNITGRVIAFGTRVNGSGYTCVDGTYNGIQLTYVSGQQPTQFGTYPTANITVTSGAVTNCVLVNAGSRLVTSGTILSCAATSLGSATPTTAFTIAIGTITTSALNTALGCYSGNVIADGATALTYANNCTYLGYFTKASADGVTNETVIGYNAIGSGSNTTTIGSSATTATKIIGVVATAQVATTLASAATIAPTLPIHFVSGATTIDTITPPPLITSTGGQITLIPTGIFTISTAGNIALARTTVINIALIMTYDATTAKWYPSY